MTTTMEIRQLLADALPLVDLDSPFLIQELSSLDITQILLLLSERYGITLTAADVTPRNFRNLAALEALVRSKQAQP